MRLAQRRESRAELRGSREPRGAGAGTHALPGPGVLRAGCGSPASFTALSLQLSRRAPGCDVKSLAGTAGRTGKKRQIRPGSVRREAAVSLGSIPKDEPGQRRTALPLPPAPGPLVSDT